MIGNQPEGYFGSEQSPNIAASYLYVISHDDGTQQFWTSYTSAIVLQNIPTHIVAAGEATFLPSQIKHGAVASNDRFEVRSCSLSIDSDDERLRRFFVMSAAVKLKMWIIRISRAEFSQTVDFETEALVVESGILSRFSFSGQTIAAELTPEPFYMEHSVPRYFCQRSCNHALYGHGCGLSPEDFMLETEIVSIDPAAREIVVLGRKGGGAAATYFEAGYFDHDETGQKFSIAWSAHTGASDTKFKLGYWHPDLAPGQTLKAYAGCRHTADDCVNRFGNGANFGGFPFVPNKNPVTNGVA